MPAMASCKSACTTGSMAALVPISREALSRISLAVTLLPRASPGSVTLNMLVMNSAMRSARSRSRVVRRSSTACMTANPTSTNAIPNATATAIRFRRTYFFSRYPALAGRATTGRFSRYRPRSAASSEGVP